VEKVKIKIMKKHIPNMLTLCNLLCGCIAVILITREQFLPAAAVILLAGIFDLFDGMVARALKVSSPIGVELDSLADMLSFGFIPGLIAFSILKYELTGLVGEIPHIWIAVLPFIAFLLTAFSALRLAKFNISEENTAFFTGMPTPANAIFWTSLMMIYWHKDVVSLSEGVYSIVFHPITIIILILLMSFLLISPLKLFTLKIKSLKNLGKYWHIFVVLFLALILIYFIGLIAIPLTILVIYPIISAIKFR
jgi:CDP-diacylglycerol--serine O-phosphatidyltransferase